MRSLQTATATGVALVAFAANSVLCRVALGETAIDAASFSTIRLMSGAVILAVLSWVARERDAPILAGDWGSAATLFLYAVPFSFAYVTLSTGTGALILFATVQCTMLAAALRSGERPGALGWAGFATAVVGLVYLVSPGVTAPTPVGAGLMVLAGVAWGAYSLRGRGVRMPVAATTGNFTRAVPFALVLSLVMLRQAELSPRGVWLAIGSGAVASGIGYVVWYAALRGLTVTRAAMVQLTVPVVAAAGGVVFLAETISVRLVAASVVILGGVALGLVSPSIRPTSNAAGRDASATRMVQLFPPGS